MVNLEEIVGSISHIILGITIGLGGFRSIKFQHTKTRFLDPNQTERLDCENRELG